MKQARHLTHHQRFAVSFASAVQAGEPMTVEDEARGVERPNATRRAAGGSPAPSSF
ncbi:hypothetical protein O4G76_03895 [Limimaricola sp. G21655-S1]|uniref:hypothetical protein n=1 Tax=Limimaricola sp. G21655-S1 TaxID=3014768 RepID=UPI0022B03F07|nr:hypothetical protein [Limimaricola sp. G21655-S1]MCZ4259981.1 hypothetical protein [Limimaricola sp. G21655-S1]